MTAIALVLVFKILISLVLLAGPFLLLPTARLEAMTGATVQSPALFRLYGLAILALLVGYASGIWTVRSGQFPWGIVAMGITSNLGAALYLLWPGSPKRLRPIAMIFGSIGLALVLAAFMPISAITPLF